MIDLVIPNKNEMELAIRAKELGITELVFLKQFKSASEAKQYAELVKGLGKIGRLVYVQKRNDCRRLDFDSLFSMVVAVSDGSEEVNRIIFESHVDAVIGISTFRGHEHTHYRYSGMNQVLAKLAADNGITYCMDFSKILNLSPSQRVTLLGRWMQNLRILKKYKAKTAMYSFATRPEELRNHEDLKAFERIL